MERRRPLPQLEGSSTVSRIAGGRRWRRLITAMNPVRSCCSACGDRAGGDWGREVRDFVVKTFEDVVNDRLDNRSFVLIAGERLTASIDSHTAATTTSVTSPTERTSMFASRNPLSAWSCGPSPRNARCSTCPRPRRSRIPSRHGRQWSVWDSVRVNVQKLVRSSARTSAGAGDRADPDSHLWGGRARELPHCFASERPSATVLPASHGRPSSPSPERA
jgi:hypothetical protein